MTTAPDRLLSHYRLVEKIGEGGMGVVWKAEDLVLRRTVAIKVLPADKARDENRRKMFLDEARLASSVSDLHIVQVFELGREGDLDFIVMEYVEGKPLSRRLQGRPLPPEEVATVGLQVAKALSRAHRKGLLHRDLKPANILVTPDGDVKVVDFGLATLFTPIEASAETDAPTISVPEEPAGGQAGGGRPGKAALVGTLPYMSPEQVSGERLDARSDIFSLGTVLYEMTTGQRPFIGPTSTDLLQGILKARPVPVHEHLTSVPLDLDRIIHKALAAHRTERYQTMEDLAVDLKHLGRELESGSSPSYDELREPLARARRRRLAMLALATAISGVVIGLGVWLAGPRARAWVGTPTADAWTVLILPMEVRGQTEGADYVGRAFAEAIAVSLAPSRSLKVLPVPAVATGATTDPMAPARNALGMGAGRLLTGALTRDGNTIHASLSLVDTRENRILWGTRRAGNEKHIADMASSLAREISVELGAALPRLYDLPLSSVGGPAMAASPLTTAALAALQGHEFPTALEATEQLVQAFPDEPDARYLRVAALSENYEIGWSAGKRDALEAGLGSLERADPEHPALDVTRADMLGSSGQIGAALALFTRALARADLTPALRAQALSRRGQYESAAGDHVAAGVDFEEALHLSPGSADIFRMSADNLRTAGSLPDAILRARQAVALAPSDTRALQALTFVLNDSGKSEEALPHAARACELARNANNCSTYAITLQHAGHGAEAAATAKEVESLPEDAGGRYNLACYWALAGHRNDALRNLRRTVDLGHVQAFFVLDPDLVSLHGDPEFEAIIAEVKKRLEIRSAATSR